MREVRALKDEELTRLQQQSALQECAYVMFFSLPPRRQGRTTEGDAGGQPHNHKPSMLYQSDSGSLHNITLKLKNHEQILREKDEGEPR